MELNYVKEFVVLAQVLHFQEAADILFIGQSTLSKHIKSLEVNLGHDLFIRSKKGVVLSDFGKAWLPYAKQFAAIEREYTAKLLEKDTASTEVNIGYLPLVTLYNFMPFFQKFKKANPLCQYNLLQGSDEELLTWLQEGKVDFILTGDAQLSETHFQKLFYTCDTLCAVLPKSHPLTSKMYLSLRDLNNESLIEFKQMPSLRQTLLEADPSVNLVPSIEVDRASVLFDLVQKGIGCSILTKHMAEHLAVPGTTVTVLQPEIEYRIYMIYHRRSPSPVTREFARYLNTAT